MTETIALWPSIKPTWVSRSSQNTARLFDHGVRKRPLSTRHHSALQKDRGRKELELKILRISRAGRGEDSGRHDCRTQALSPQTINTFVD